MLLSHWLLSHRASLSHTKRSPLTSLHSWTSVLHPIPPSQLSSSQMATHEASFILLFLLCGSTCVNLVSIFVAPPKQLPWNHQWLLWLNSTDTFGPHDTCLIRSIWQFLPSSWNVFSSISRTQNTPSIPSTSQAVASQNLQVHLPRPSNKPELHRAQCQALFFSCACEFSHQKIHSTPMAFIGTKRTWLTDLDSQLHPPLWTLETNIQWPTRSFCSKI